jgi:hypothetical protein
MTHLPDPTNTLTYKFLKDFSLPLLAIIWAIYSYTRQHKRRLSIRQVGDQYSDRIDSPGNGRTAYSVEVAITNDSPQAAIVIAYYDIQLPWNEPNLDPHMDPQTQEPPQEFYSVGGSYNIQISRDEVLNHRRFQSGRLGPGEAFRGYFLAKGDNPIPEDIRSKDRDRWVEAKFVVQDTTGKEYRTKIHLHY